MAPSKSLASIAVILLLAVGLAAAGGTNSVDAGPLTLFALCGLIAFVVNWLVYVPSQLAQTEHYFDLTGSLTYITVAAVGLLASDTRDARSVLVAVLVWIWAARLGSFLFLRIRRDGKDGRFDRIKTNPLQFLMTWTLQGLWVFLTLAAGLVALTTDAPKDFDALAIVGLVVWVAGFAIEVAADRQKSAFRADPANQGKFITVGLWAWSRHPNYFGEITLWTGIALIALPVMDGWQYVTLISPVFVFVLLTRISGIPMLTRRSLKRWGDDPEFMAYFESTPALVPRPPKKR